MPQTAPHFLTSCRTPPGGLYVLFMLSTLLALEMFVNVQAVTSTGHGDTETRRLIRES